MTAGSVVESQTTSRVLMVRPADFASNPETAPSNQFQRQPGAPVDLREAHHAGQEFAALRAALDTAGVHIEVFDDTPDPVTPDAVFPNNWISTHRDGTVVLYPMLADNRRLERRMDIVEALATARGYVVREVIDLSHHERAGHFLESTGSMVLDRPRRIAYACLSPRTSLDALGDFAQRLDYEVVAFDAVDRTGAPIYHTNVMMTIGTDFAIICSEAIREQEKRAAVLAQLRAAGHDIIDIRYAQMEAFAGNQLELKSVAGGRVLALSERALISLDSEQRSMLEGGATLVAVPIPHIEDSAGGSIRCMLAEIHLPLRVPGQF